MLPTNQKADIVFHELIAFFFFALPFKNRSQFFLLSGRFFVYVFVYLFCASIAHCGYGWLVNSLKIYDVEFMKCPLNLYGFRREWFVVKRTNVFANWIFSTFSYGNFCLLQWWWIGWLAQWISDTFLQITWFNSVLWCLPLISKLHSVCV